MGKKFAVYGGIGSGKSTVMAILKENGYSCLSADDINGSLMDEPEYIAALGRAFPFTISDGKVDRAALANAVFSDKKQLKLLNSIAHPLILQQIENAEGDNIFVETPLYLESGAARLFDKALYVYAPVRTRIKRLKGRGMKTGAILKRMRAQAPPSAQKKAADIVIDNSGSLNDLRQNVMSALKTLFD